MHVFHLVRFDLADQRKRVSTHKMKNKLAVHAQLVREAGDFLRNVGLAGSRLTLQADYKWFTRLGLWPEMTVQCVHDNIVDQMLAKQIFLEITLKSCKQE